MAKNKENSKEWYKSRTIWINVLAIVIGVLQGIQGDLTSGGTLTVAGLINLVLRNVTNTAIK